MAMENSIAEGNPDDQKIFKTMLRKMHTKSMHNKLNSITKGDRSGLDYIEVPKGEWFYLSKNE